MTSGIRDSALPESSGQQVVLSVTKSKPAFFQSQAMLLYVCALQLVFLNNDLGQIAEVLSVTKSKPASFQSQAMLLYVCTLQLVFVK